ncbi:MAG TPA: rod shape-determining protein RodA [Gammaproteobacteria bacterium]|nr:rod shape-determining protein RodA [Gammaproteobacteria bacterium]
MNMNRNPSSPIAQLLRGLHLDLPLLAGLLALMGISMVVLWSAGGESSALLFRQGLRLAIALAGMLFIAQVSPHYLRMWTPWVYLAGVVLLLLVLVTGDIGKGAQRWLDLGFVRFQPSELMKLAVPMMVAWYLNDRPLPPRFADLLVAGLIVAIPAALIIEQPDLGTSLLVISGGAFAIFLAGLRWRWILGLFAMFAVAAPLAWHFMLHNYQKQRVLTFLNPESDPLNTGYHIIQSKIAIGSGGLFGKGWLNGTQSQLEFLPERHTDFIFAVIGEEFGLLGAALVLAVYAYVIARGLYMALQADKTYERIVAGSLTLTFFVYVFVNVGMVTGLLPVVGVPLPLISYGGTSMVTLLGGFGILMSIHSHRRFVSH